MFPGMWKQSRSPKVSQGPRGKRKIGLEVILFIPPSPCWAGMPLPTKLRGCVALKLAAVNVVSDTIDLIIADLTFLMHGKSLLTEPRSNASPTSTAGPLKGLRTFPV